MTNRQKSRTQVILRDMFHVLPSTVEAEIAPIHVAPLHLIEPRHVEQCDVGEEGLRPHVEHDRAERAHSERAATALFLRVDLEHGSLLLSVLLHVLQSLLHILLLLHLLPVLR